MFPSRYMPCQRCGASLERSEEAAHECSVDRLLDFWMFGLREELTTFDQKLRTYLDSAVGRFDVWEAARTVRLPAG